MRLIGLAVVLVLGFFVPVVAEAQQLKIGVLCTGGLCPIPGASAASQLALADALSRVGLVQGRTLMWDFGSITSSEDRVAVEASKLVSRHPTLIPVWGNVTAARAAKDATRAIPIVLMAVPDVVENGLVESLRRPGGNITGISVPTIDLIIKQLEILKEINPQLKTIVVVQGDIDRGERHTLDRLRGAAASLQLDGGFSVADVSNVRQALAAAPAGRSGVVAIGNISLTADRQLKDSAIERKLPVVMPWPRGSRVDTTLLMSYGPRFSAVAERTAALIDRIVKGARPEDLPVEEPVSYELVIDGVMAKALGLTIPPGVRIRAAEIIE